MIHINHRQQLYQLIWERDKIIGLLMDVLFLSAQPLLHPMVDNQKTLIAHKCTTRQKEVSTIP